MVLFPWFPGFAEVPQNRLLSEKRQSVPTGLWLAGFVFFVIAFLTQSLQSVKKQLAVTNTILFPLLDPVESG